MDVIVSTHSRAKAAANALLRACSAFSCFNTQPREGGCVSASDFLDVNYVSTHSRAKAAAPFHGVVFKLRTGFNTQPREGGCSKLVLSEHSVRGFNTQPREGGCA